MRVVKVSLGSRSYKISIGAKLLADAGKECARLRLGARCAIISDSNVAPRYEAVVRQSLKRAGFDSVTIILPAGEKAKSLKSVAHCYDHLARHRLERKSFIVALGGGVVGDLAGYVAATYLRGVEFVQAPTTLLAQVDSSVGGKVGINLKAGKNLVGAFHQPRLVLSDLDCLRSLPPREYRAGLAEIIKYGIIYDARLFGQLERHLPELLERDPETLASIVARCCEIKADIVAQDEKETGVRAILNFGHTIGHALEAISGYGKFLHGEAIAIGQVLEARLSIALLGLPSDDAVRITELFRRAGLPIAIRLTAAQIEKLHAAMRLDKKVAAGEIKFVLVDKIGRAVSGQTAPAAVVRGLFSQKPSHKYLQRRQ